MHPKVDEYIAKKSEWKAELELLRSAFKDLPLEETIKWGAPTYVYKGKNVVGLAAFKNYCGLWFFQGALINDKYNVFINAQEGKTKAMLQWRFNSIDEIDIKKIKEYTLEAINNVEEGKEIKPKKNTKPVVIPSELEIEFSKDTSLENNFKNLSLSCQREYAEYITEAKRETTRLRRLEKIIPMIKEQKGLNDKYKNC